MAHDNQYKEQAEAPVVDHVGCPRKGEYYWDRYDHTVRRADRDLEMRAPIIDMGKSE